MHRATLTDFDIPRKYGLRQTSGDALGVGGSFRGLRTIPVMFSLLRDMEEVCPDALFLNYVNPSEHPVLGDGASLRYPHRRPLPQRSRDRTSVGQVPRCKHQWRRVSRRGHQPHGKVPRLNRRWPRSLPRFQGGDG
jgi:hypothetical protein